MKESTTKKAEFAANIAIILVALMVVVLLVRKNFLDKPTQPDAQPEPAVGTAISLPGVDWTTHEKNLLMVLSTQCRFCSESAPFYRKLAEETHGHTDTRLIALLPQDKAEAKKYLSGLEMQIEEVLQAASDSVGAKGFPTLILINRQGVVAKTWVGQLPSSQEAEVFDRLR